ncbi:MAG: hypothetical protein M1836_005038 [Candelina mexicana]|nr:MAG: hypothetical protein M1836_005038 [Candelina mexicana]
MSTTEKFKDETEPAYGSRCETHSGSNPLAPPKPPKKERLGQLDTECSTAAVVGYLYAATAAGSDQLPGPRTRAKLPWSPLGVSGRRFQRGPGAKLPGRSNERVPVRRSPHTTNPQEQATRRLARCIKQPERRLGCLYAQRLWARGEPPPIPSAPAERTEAKKIRSEIIDNIRGKRDLLSGLARSPRPLRLSICPTAVGSENG